MLCNINKLIHNNTTDWTIVDEDQYGAIVLPNTHRVTQEQGHCAATAIGILTNTLCETVIRDMRRYDPTSCTVQHPGTEIHVVDSIMSKLFNTTYCVHETQFNTFQEYVSTGTYLVFTTNTKGEEPHYTVLQDGIEYGAGTSANMTVRGYWQID